MKISSTSIFPCGYLMDGENCSEQKNDGTKVLKQFVIERTKETKKETYKRYKLLQMFYCS